MMTENLHDNRKQLENSLANLKIELLPDVKQSKDDKISQFVLQLLGDLKVKEERSLSKLKKLRKDLKAMDITCHEFELKVSQVHENPEFIKMIQQLLDDLESQKEHHSQDVKEFRKEIKINENKCHQLSVSQVHENPEFIKMRQQLLDDLEGQKEQHSQEVKEFRKEIKINEIEVFDVLKKIIEMQEFQKIQDQRHLQEVTELRKELKINVNMCQQLTNEVFEMQKSLGSQEERHLLEINEKHKELESKDSLCQQLELKVSQVRENPEFIQMRQQLLDELEGQEELHLGEMNELRKELEDKDIICHQLEQENAEFIQVQEQLIEKEEEAAQLRDRLNFNVSCPICMDPYNSSEHRMVALLCGHIFGESCARQCLEEYLDCPECRAPASENDIRNLFPR